MGHDHTHLCHEPSPGFEKQFFIGILLNTGFIVLEVLYGFFANSLALLADAAHNASDVIGLFLAWIAVFLSKKRPSSRYTYGLRSSTILAALANAIILVIACLSIAWDAFFRFTNPQPVSGMTVMVIAGIGVLINGVTAWLFMSGRKTDLNIEGAFLHMASDALVSLGVLVTGGLILFTKWYWVDPALSILISILILVGTWNLFKNSFNLALHGTPEHIKTQSVRTYLESQPGVKNVHDLHIWAMSTSESALSVHLIMEDGHPGDLFLHNLAHGLKDQFRIDHSTIQIEVGDGPECSLIPDHVV
jgi:cobalt-zinc-cadmium efflux system protein